MTLYELGIVMLYRNRRALRLPHCVRMWLLRRAHRILARDMQRIAERWLKRGRRLENRGER